MIGFPHIIYHDDEDSIRWLCGELRRRLVDVAGRNIHFQPIMRKDNDLVAAIDFCIQPFGLRRCVIHRTMPSPKDCLCANVWGKELPQSLLKLTHSAFVFENPVGPLSGPWLRRVH